MRAVAWRHTQAGIERRRAAAAQEAEAALAAIEQDNKPLPHLRLVQASEVQAPDVVAQYREIPVVIAKKSAAKLMDEVAEDFGTTVQVLKGISRNREIVHARQMAMYRVRKERPDLSLPVIGRAFNRDHTTVLHAIRKIEKLLEGEQQ